MEEQPMPLDQEELVAKPQNPEKQFSPATSPTDGSKKVRKPTIPATSRLLSPIGAIRKRAEQRSGSDLSSNVKKPVVSASDRSSGSVPVRRNNTGGVLDKSSVSAVKKQTNVTNVSGRKNGVVLDPSRTSLPELRRSSLPTKPVTSTSVLGAKKSVPASSAVKVLRTSTGSDVTKPETLRKPAIKPALSVSSSVSSLLASQFYFCG